MSRRGTIERRLDLRAQLRRTLPTSRLGAALCGAAILAMVSAPPVGAESRERGAHVHGHGRLDVAIEGGKVVIELAAPGADIVGFEHRPRTKAQKEAVQKATAILKSGAKLFGFPDAARCRFATAHLESEHEEGAHKHGASDEETHSEFHARYVFNCDRPDRLSHLNVEVFRFFPASKELRARAISPRGQTARELTPGSARLTF